MYVYINQPYRNSEFVKNLGSGVNDAVVIGVAFFLGVVPAAVPHEAETETLRQLVLSVQQLPVHVP